MSEWKFQPIKSSNLLEAAHDGTDKCRVKFANGVYENTKPVSAEDFKRFAATFQTKDSSGSYFHKNLKQFEFKKVE